MAERLVEAEGVGGSSPSASTSGNGTSSFGVGAKCMAPKRFACLYRPDAMKTT